MSRRMQYLPLMLACALTAPGFALAQTAGGLKIGVVNVAKLIQDSPQAIALNQALKDQFAPRQKELVAKQNELKERQAKLDKDGPVMGADERRVAENRQRDDERDLNRKQNDFLEDLQNRRNEELGKLQRDLLREVQSFAKQNGYDLILGDGVFYAGQKLDVTEQVLAGFKSKGAAPAPAPAPKP